MNRSAEFGASALDLLRAHVAGETYIREPEVAAIVNAAVQTLPAPLRAGLRPSPKIIRAMRTKRQTCKRCIRARIE